MRSHRLAAVVLAVTLLPVAAQAESYQERLAKRDEAKARERCLKEGAKPDTPELEKCVRETTEWMARNRAMQQRIYTD